MKVMNPNYVAPADAKAAALKTKLAAYFAANPQVQAVDFDELKTRFAAEAGAMTPGALHQAAINAGWTVDRD